MSLLTRLRTGFSARDPAAGPWVPLALALALGAVAVLPRPAAAQSPSLAHVDSLAAAGRVSEARAELGRWMKRHKRADAGDRRARALLLRARLAPDFRIAESDLMAVVLGYPATPQAAPALLRLGQGLQAAGQHDRAAGYLRQLVTDYPTSPLRPLAYLWLARAERAAHRPAAACAAVTRGLSIAPGPGIRGALRDQQDLCRSDTAAAASPPTAAAPATRGAGRATRGTEPKRTSRASSQATPKRTSKPARPAARARSREPAGAKSHRPRAEVGRFAVQVGAFRAVAAARRLAARVRRAGFQPRVVHVRGSDLIRVRVGRYADLHQATDALKRLRKARLDGVVVGDLGRESAVESRAGSSSGSGPV